MEGGMKRNNNNIRRVFLIKGKRFLEIAGEIAAISQPGFI
jgi:hypothetical protein